MKAGFLTRPKHNDSSSLRKQFVAIVGTGNTHESNRKLAEFLEKHVPLSKKLDNDTDELTVCFATVIMIQRFCGKFGSQLKDVEAAFVYFELLYRRMRFAHHLNNQSFSFDGQTSVCVFSFYEDLHHFLELLAEFPWPRSLCMLLQDRLLLEWDQFPYFAMEIRRGLRADLLQLRLGPQVKELDFPERVKLACAAIKSGLPSVGEVVYFVTQICGTTSFPAAWEAMEKIGGPVAEFVALTVPNPKPSNALLVPKRCFPILRPRVEMSKLGFLELGLWPSYGGLSVVPVSLGEGHSLIEVHDLGVECSQMQLPPEIVRARDFLLNPFADPEVVFLAKILEWMGVIVRTKRKWVNGNGTCIWMPDVACPVYSVNLDYCGSNSSDTVAKINEKARCSVCSKEMPSIISCSKCHTQIYCSRDCQKKDWSDHKYICKKISNE